MSFWKIVIILAVCLLLVVTGIYLDGASFIGNLIAGAFDVLITVTIIAWLLQRQRKKQWRKVRSQIVEAITQHISNIASEYMTHFYGPGFDLLSFAEDIGAGYEKASPRTATALQKMADMLQKAERPDDAREKAEELHSVIKWDIAQIRDSLLPRILAMEFDETELVAVLGELDNAERRWVNQIIIDKEVSAGDQFSAAVNTFRTATQVYQYIANHGEVPQT
jgi:hypothetical protein